MTAIDCGIAATTRPRSRFGLSMRLRRLLARLRRHRRMVRTYMELSRLDDRLLYDMGIEPLDLHEVLRKDLPPSMLLDAMRHQLQPGDGRRK